MNSLGNDAAAAMKAQYQYAAAELVKTQQYAGDVAAPPHRMTPSIRDRGRGQIARVNEMCAAVAEMADELFGPVPMPANAPTGGLASGQVQRAPPLMEEIEHNLFLMDEALESLQRQLARFARL